MTTIFRLDSSIRVEGSVTRAVADTVESAAVGELGGAKVIRRDVGTAPLPSEAWSTSAFAGFVPEADWTNDQRAARALAGELADELEQSDAFIIATPLYNFGVSQHIKTWIDLVITDPSVCADGRDD